jgi:primary-amine oxidase
MVAVEDPATPPLVDDTKASGTRHPIAQLTAGEITESAKLIRALWPANADLQFKVITLQEPKKAEFMPFLTAEHNGTRTPVIERRSFVVYYIRNTVMSIL